MEMVARKSDLRIGPSANIGSSLAIWMPSLNFRSEFWQNRHQIWIQRTKMMKIGYLLVFFAAVRPRVGVEARVGRSTAQARAPGLGKVCMCHVAAQDWSSDVKRGGGGGATWRCVIGRQDSEDPTRRPVRGPHGTRGALLLAGASRRTCTGRTEQRRRDTWQHQAVSGARRGCTRWPPRGFGRAQ